MPVTVSYPGVYVQEIPSGSQTIGGVATSITAFVGRTYRGPVNIATPIYSFADFQRKFGGLAHGYPLGFAVRDFYQNGGSQAIIARVYGPEWLTYPVAPVAQGYAATAVQTVMGAMGTMPTSPTDADVATAAASAAASYYGGEYPEQYAAANYMAQQADAWSVALQGAKVSDLTAYLGEVASLMQSGASAVLNAMSAPGSYGLAEIGSPPPDDVRVVEAAQTAAANQIPGPQQEAANLVVQAVVNEYDTDAAASYATLIAAAQTAVDQVNAAVQVLENAIPSPAPSTPADLLVDVVNAVPTAGAAGSVEETAALTGANAMLARVYPEFQLLPGTALPVATPLGEVLLNQLAEGGASSAAVQAALPSTTASIVLQAPAGFSAVAAAANSVAQAAWLAVLDNQTGMATATAAQETANFVKSNNPTLPAASQAASTVATAVQGALLQGAAAAATAGSKAVAGAVQSALNLAASNGAVAGLQSAQAVALASWNAAAGTPGAQTVTQAVNGAPSRSAAQAVAALADAQGTPRAVALGVSQGLVAATIGALPSLTLNAADPGDWPNGSLTVTLDTNGITPGSVASMNLTPAPGGAAFSVGDLFNLSVGYTAPDGSSMSERWSGVSLRYDAGSQRIDRVLANGSNLIRYLPGTTDGSYPTTTPSTVPVSGASGTAGTGPDGTMEPGLQGTPSQPLTLEDFLGNQSTYTGIYALGQVDQFDLMSIPPDAMIETAPPAIPPQDPNDTWRMELYQTAAQFCQAHRAMLIIDPPTNWAIEVQAGNTSNIKVTDLGTYGPEGEYAAVYFPYLVEGNPLMNGQLGYFAPSGAIAGIMSRTDAARGVWKAPAGITDGALSGTMGLELKLSDTDNGLLNPQGINCLRTFPVYGNVVWGARTLKGADVLNDDYKYVPVRRLALYIEDSLLRGMQWAVFEPNAEPLWAQIRLSVGSFMNTLYRQGAFAGATAKDAYYVACDATTTTQDDINMGIVNVQIGFAPLKPAEFVVITIQQIAGQTPT